MSEAIKAFEKNLEPNLKRLLADTRNASAKAAVVVLKRQLSMRSAIRAAYSDDQPRDKGGEWTAGYHVIEHKSDGTTKHHGVYKTKKEAHSVGSKLRKSGRADTYVFHSDDLKNVGRDSFKVHEGMRAAAGPTIKSWGFDATNPAALKWVEEHATELITDLSDTTREDIKDLLEQAFEGDFDVDELTSQIADTLGDDERADLIARTETMRASNEGQQEAWDQAVEDGLLTGNERQEWIVTPDDRLCPICEPMDGVVTDLDGYFDVDGDQIDGPPAHPRCRCTIGLVV